MLERIRDSKFRLHDIMLMAIVFLIPLIVGYYKIQLTPFELKLSAAQTFVDVFNYWKVQFLFILSIVGILSLMMDFLILGKKKFDKRLSVAISVFALMTVFAYAFSIDRVVAWRGILDRFEGLEAWSAYIIILILAYDMVLFHGKKRSVRVISYTALSGALVIGIIGTLQYFGVELLNTDLVRYTIAPDSVAKADAMFFDATGRTYSTLSNPNYYGAYMSIMSLVALYSSLEEKGVLKYILLGIGGLSVFNMVVSQSSAGFLGFAVTFPILIKIMLLEKRSDQFIYVFSAIGFFLLLIFGKLANFQFPAESLVISGMLALLSGLVFLTHYKQFIIDKRLVLVVLGILIVGSGVWGFVHYKNSPSLSYNYLHDIRVDKSKLMMKWESGDVNIEIKDGNELVFKSGDAPLAVDSDATKDGFVNYTVNDKNLSWLSFTVAHTKEFDTLRIEPCGAIFFMYKGNFMWVGINKEQAEISNTEFFGLKGFEKLASGRGYIWSRSVQQLPYSLLVGVGPDNFAFQFPQQDLLGKTNMGGTNLYIDKPHNLYLKLWIEMGLVGLLAFLYLMIKPLKCLFEKKLEKIQPVAILCGALIMNFAVASVFNDSLPSVMPIYMAFLGLGLGPNDKLENIKTS